MQEDRASACTREGLEAARRATRGAGAASLHTVKQIRFGASRFFCTVQSYVVKVCPYVGGTDATVPTDFHGPKVVFEAAHGHKVIAFAPSVPSRRRFLPAASAQREPRITSD